MEWWIALTGLVGGLLFLLALGLPVAIAFFLLNIVGALLFLGGDAGLIQLVRNSTVSVTNFVLVPIPLFLLMGEILFRTGLASRAIDAVDQLISKVPGRLSIVAIFGGSVFASLSGSSMANTAMLGSTLLPEMKQRGYHPTMSMGPIMGTGGIAVLIPPSGLAVLLGSLGQISIGDLLIAGILPGALITAMYVAYVIARCWMNPALAPPYAVQPAQGWARWRPFLLHVVPLLGIFVCVIGSMLAGIATPTESAALGAFASIFAAACYRRLTVAALKTALLSTAKITAMIFFIVAASLTFSQILAFSGATSGFLQLINGFDASPMTLLILMLVIALVLGSFMDPISVMMIVLPFFMPLVRSLGFDLVWFGVLLLVVLEVGFLTPPVGMLLFVMKGVAPPDTRMGDIIRAALPFVVLQLLAVAIIILWPGIATILPALSRG